MFIYGPTPCWRPSALLEAWPCTLLESWSPAGGLAFYWRPGALLEVVCLLDSLYPAGGRVPYRRPCRSCALQELWCPTGSPAHYRRPCALQESWRPNGGHKPYRRPGTLQEGPVPYWRPWRLTGGLGAQARQCPRIYIQIMLAAITRPSSVGARRSAHVAMYKLPPVSYVGWRAL